MGNAYYIGKRRRRRNRKKRFLLLFLALLSTLLVICRFSFYPYIEAYAESESKKRLTALSAEKISEVLSKNGYGYEDLIRLSYTAEGRLATAQINTPLLNLLRQEIAKEILSALKNHTLAVRVPTSILLGTVLLSSTRGGITVHLECAESMSASFFSRFEECGINQTRHLVTFDFSLELCLLLPMRYKTITVLSSVVAVETLIIGEVPDSFTDIDRLTDSVDEISIDDAVDFGSVLD